MSACSGRFESPSLRRASPHLTLTLRIAAVVKVGVHRRNTEREMTNHWIYLGITVCLDGSRAKADSRSATNPGSRRPKSWSPNHRPCCDGCGLRREPGQPGDHRCPPLGCQCLAPIRALGFSPCAGAKWKVAGDLVTITVCHDSRHRGQPGAARLWVGRRWSKAAKPSWIGDHGSFGELSGTALDEFSSVV